MQVYKFRLHENPEFGWNPSMNAIDFMNVLSNITAIKIRGSYSSQGIGFLDNVKLASAVRGNSGEQAKWIERCNCPEGYQGQFCQYCIPGYHHENNNGPFDRCVPCKCNGHADTCDVESGQCQCQHNTDGHNCESCARQVKKYPTSFSIKISKFLSSGKTHSSLVLGDISEMRC